MPGYFRLPPPLGEGRETQKTWREYQNGASVAEAVFDHKYLVESLRAVGDVVEIVFTEQDVDNSTWIGEEQTSFF